MGESGDLNIFRNNRINIQGHKNVLNMLMWLKENMNIIRRVRYENESTK